MGERRDDTDFSDFGDEKTSFRRKLSEGLTGLLDPDGAFGKGRGYVSEIAQGTKAEIIRVLSSELRSFLDGMDSVDLLQQVIAGLVIDVHTQVRFSLDKDKKKLEPTLQSTKVDMHSPSSPVAKTASTAANVANSSSISGSNPDEE